MEGIKVVAVLVKCTQSLLLCEDIDTSTQRFTDIEHCTQLLPQLMAGAREEVGPRWVVMGKCKFQLNDNRRAPYKASRTPSG
jgi:hypothetical protein